MNSLIWKDRLLPVTVTSQRGWVDKWDKNTNVPTFYILILNGGVGTLNGLLENDNLHSLYM